MFWCNSCIKMKKHCFQEAKLPASRKQEKTTVRVLENRRRSWQIWCLDDVLCPSRSTRRCRTFDLYSKNWSSMLSTVTFRSRTMTRASSAAAWKANQRTPWERLYKMKHRKRLLDEWTNLRGDGQVLEAAARSLQDDVLEVRDGAPLPGDDREPLHDLFARQRRRSTSRTELQTCRNSRRWMVLGHACSTAQFKGKNWVVTEW